MLIRRDKNEPPRSFPRWLSWLFLAFLIYVLYLGNMHAHRTEKTVAPDAATSLQNYPQLTTATDADRWKRALNPDYVGNVKTVDIAEGDGEPAQCGQQITITLRGTTSEGTNFDPAHKDDQTLTLRLGSAPYKALDNALLGLKPGGKRRVDAPPQLIYSDTGHKTSDTILLYIERTDHPAKHEGLPLIASDEVVGSGPGAACGEKTAFDITVWNDKGAAAYKTEAPLSLTLGAREVNPGLDAGLIGIAEGGTRLLVLPPADLGVAKDEKLIPLRNALPASRVSLVRVSRPFARPVQK